VVVEGCKLQSKKSGARNDKNGEKETADEKGLFLMEICKVEKDVLRAAGEDESKKRKGGDQVGRECWRVSSVAAAAAEPPSLNSSFST
jgi:hypothetical protein